ncbi:MAG: hypothetical protein PHD10_05095 [Bacilli bacterium]|nr:hypothetical protein [Bacilli bacterium]
MKKIKWLTIWNLVKLLSLLLFIIFILSVFLNQNNSIKIIDNTENCAESLEQFYEDEHYVYYFPCIQSETVYVKIYNEPKILIKDALKSNKITIDQLEGAGLKFYKEAKFELNIKSSDECKVNTLISKEESKLDYNIYSYCLEEVSIVINENFYTLKDALLTSKINMDEIINKMEYDSKYGQTIKDAFNDGGTTIYKNFSYSILKCKKLLGTNDIYIGNSSLGYGNDFCE